MSTKGITHTTQLFIARMTTWKLKSPLRLVSVSELRQALPMKSWEFARFLLFNKWSADKKQELQEIIALIEYLQTQADGFLELSPGVAVKICCTPINKCEHCGYEKSTPRHADVCNDMITMRDRVLSKLIAG